MEKHGLNPQQISYAGSAALLERSRKLIAGGVSSEFRKYGHPHALFYTHGQGSRLYDVDGNEYLDFTLSQGPMILGHSHPKVLAAVTAYSAQGQMFAGQHIKEVELAEKLHQWIPSAEMMRFCLDGSEAVQTAFRVARAKTGRPKFLRFEGHYHGWLDNVAWGLSAPSLEALGSREHPNVFPWSQGLAEHASDEFIILPWNDLELLKKTMAERHHEIAAIITEGVMCNNGCILPEQGFLQGIRDLCTEYGSAFILDEVITGFRLGISGAQGYFGVTPDLSIFAKAMGSGYPISAIVGKREWMELIESSKVIHAGTMNSSNPTVAAALATITVLEEENPYERMFRLGKKLMAGLQKAAEESGQPLLVQGPGPMFNVAFTGLKAVKDYRDTLTGDKARLGKFIAALHDKKIRVIGRGLWYISAVHTEEEIDFAIATATEVLQNL
jgi:glutamate-1-semialdehyde 2,1-aminomutase